MKRIAPSRSHSHSHQEMLAMKSKTTVTIATALLALAVLARAATSAEDKYTLKVPGGLAFSEFRGYEDWQAVGVSHPQEAQTFNVIVANPTMIAAFRAGIPGNGRPFPDGSRMAKMTYGSRQQPGAPFSSKVPGELLGVGFMVRDGKRFSDSGGWGWAQFKYDAASETFAPFTMTDTPPQANDARCGFACHTAAKGKDYVFTEYAKR
jgi:Cytochrome P460